jgi:ribosomal protein S1
MAENGNEVTTQLKKKDEVKGKVIKTTLSGAIVDIGSAKTAVIPISQLRKEPVRKVEEVVKEGDEVVAWVRRIGPEHDRIELTLIRPLLLEWREIKKDMVLKGKVSKIEKFGAFVDLGAERPGLVHVSEMSHEYVKRPEDAVKVGDEVEVKVLDMDRRKKQIKLSMKAMTPEPPPPQPKAAQPKTSPSKAQAQEEVAEQAEPPAPTAMEVALRKAMSAGEGEQAVKGRPVKSEKGSAEMEDILSRTLENRVKSK